MKQIYEGKKPLYTFSPPAANESALKANHQAVVDVTKDTLTDGPVVLFKEKGFVDALREWVGVGGEFGDMKGGEDLRDLFNAHIRGRPFHSQAAERAVNASVQTSVYGKEADFMTSVKRR